ncbi:MAG: hypothetical protein JXR25_17150 [Pontiellaceae bacterium]|nr:hypothetical protein [Pontiellaceae bacterium]
MDVQDLHAEAWAGIQKGYELGRLGHAYVIVGSPRGSGLYFAEEFLKLLFCESSDRPCGVCSSCRRVGGHKHADTLWIEPQSKARQIKADEIRELVRRITQTSFEGGWKAGIVLAAECLNTQSANVLLKTLEEPPPKTLLLLVTDAPQALLPTIISRCQKIVLSSAGTEKADAVWRQPLLDILRDLPPANGLSAARLASQMKGLSDFIKAGIAEMVEADIGQNEAALDESKLKEILAARTLARLKEVLAEILQAMLDWHRDILLLTSGVGEEHLIYGEERKNLAEQAKLHTQGSALKAMEIVEGIGTRLNRNIPELQIFDEAFRKLVRR